MSEETENHASAADAEKVEHAANPPVANSTYVKPSMLEYFNIFSEAYASP